MTPPTCVTCGTALLPRYEKTPWPTICGGEFRTTDAETADEIAALARARFPNALVSGMHTDASSANPRLAGKEIVHHIARVEGYADTFDCLEAFEAKWAPFAAAARGRFHTHLEWEPKR